MTDSAARPAPVSRLLWAGAFVLAVLACAGSLTGAMTGARWGPIAAAGSAVVLLAVFVVLSLRHGAALRDAALQRAQNAQLMARSRHCQAAHERHLAECRRREDAHRAWLEARSEALEAVARHLAGVAIPAALDGAAVPAPPQDAGGDAEVAAVFRPVADALAGAAARLRERLAGQQESSRLAVVALARRVQASAHRIQEEAAQMAERHPANADVLESSMRVDHAAAQQARHAQSVAVLCGEWPAQQWPDPLALVDVVRAAAGRIVPYTRVKVVGDPDVAAAAMAVEPLIHLVAELLANATQSSPPATQVQVAVRTVQRGAVIEIDDGGVGMDDRRLEQAREVAAGRRPAGLAELGEIPQTGLAVVGQYAHRHAFRVDLMPSAYGGVRAVVLVPGEVMEVLEPAGTQPAGTSADVPAMRETALAAVPPAGAMPAGGALPQRRSRRSDPAPAAAAAGGRQPGPDQEGMSRTGPALSPEQAGAWMSAFLNGQPPAGTGADTGGAADTAGGQHEQRGRS